MNRVRLAAFANERISYYLLKKLYQKNIKVPLIFTSSSKRKKKISDWIDLSSFKKNFGNPTIKKINSPNSFIVKKTLSKFKPDYLLVMSWSQIIPKNILNIPKKGIIAFHYSNLPKRRGGAPLFWAINDGLKKIGITMYFMQEGIDDGDIVNSYNIKLDKYQNVGALLKKIYKTLPNFYSKNLKKIF